MNDVVQQVGERTFAEGLAGFASYIRSTIRSGHVDFDDAEMFAKKFDAASAEVTRLREALEAAEKRIQADIDNWEYTMPSEHLQYNIEGGRDTLAKARAALGKPSITEPQARPHPPTP